MEVLVRLLALVGKEFLAVLKDPKSRFVLFGPPLLQFFVFGYAATFDVSDVRYALLDRDRSAESRALLARFESSEAFRHVVTLESSAQIDEWIDPQRVRLVLHVGPRFSEQLAAGETATLQVLVDGRNSNVAQTALGYAGQIVAEYGAALRGRSPGEEPAPRVRLVERSWYNPNFESRWYIVSALGAVVASVIVTLLASLSVAREREFGTFDQLLVTPLSTPEILLGKAAPPFVFGLLEALLLSVAGVLWFGVPFLGSALALVATLAALILSIIGVGLFISSLATTMQQGLLGSFAFLMPAIILSGFTTPVENMPEWLQAGTLANPLRYGVEALRAIHLEAAGLPEVAGSLAAMLAIAACTLPVAAGFFRRRSR